MWECRKLYSNPATTEAGVDSILEKLREEASWSASYECSVAQEVYGRMRKVVGDYEFTIGDGTDYNKKDLEDSDKTVKVNASYKKAKKEEWMKGIVTTTITKNNTSIAKGSTIEEHFTITTASYSNQCVLGFTAITTAGSVKIIFDFTGSDTWSGGSSEPTEKYSGSLKIFGKDDKLLLSKPVNDSDTYHEAQKMIGIRVED